MTKGKSFFPKQTCSCRACCSTEWGICTLWSGEGKCVAVCLFGTKQKKKKRKKERFSLLGQSSFLNTFGVFFSSGSAAICVHACVCVCVCLPQLHFVDDAVTAVGILDAYQSLSRQKKETIYLFLRQTHAGMHTNTHRHTHTHTHTHTHPAATFSFLSSPMCGLGGLSGL